MAKGMTKEKAEKKIEEKLESTKVPQTLAIRPPKLRMIRMTLVGVSPFLSHAFSDRAQRLMLEKQKQGGSKKGPKAVREARNPERDFEESQYRDSKGRDCILARAIKKSIVNAASFTDASPGLVKGTVFVLNEMIPLKFSKKEMRQDIVRLKDIGRTANLCFRAEYHDWSCDVDVMFDEGLLPIEQLVAIVNRAGFSVGVGDWRPNCSGEHGRFRVDTVKGVGAKTE